MESGKIIVVANQKGGVAKTSTVRNLSYALAEMGKKVLVVDFDPQYNLTTSFGVLPTQAPYNTGTLITNLLLDESLPDTNEFIQKIGSVDLIPSSRSLTVAEANLLMTPDSNDYLAALLNPLRLSYDYIIVDTNPSLGSLTINALTAADEVIIPIDPELFALTGLQALVDTIHVELRQRREGGADYVLLAPGNYGADYIKGAMGIDPATAVMTSNFIGDALEMCRELGFRGALLVGHIGKLVKLAGAMWNTHSRYGDCRMDILTACAAAEGLHGGAAAEMLCCATCDDALRLLKEQGLYDAVLHRLAGRIDAMLPYKCGDMEAGAILFSKEYGYLCGTKGAAALLRRIKED